MDNLNEYQKQVERLLIEKGFDRNHDRKTILQKLIWLVNEGFEAIVKLLCNDIEGCKEEVADTFFYALDAMTRLDGDLIDEFYKKLDKNFKRPKKYGVSKEFREEHLLTIANRFGYIYVLLDTYKKTGDFRAFQLYLCNK